MDKKKKEPDFIPFRNPYNTGGRPLKFTPVELAEKFDEFVKWAHKHPLKVKKTATTTGQSSVTSVSIEERPRLISVVQFLNWLGTTRDWWAKLSDGKQADDFLHVKDYITQYCYEYQYEAASSWQYNGNIVSRYLGLAEKKQLSGEKGPLTFIVKSEEEKDKLAEIGNLGV
jgi:hypothetical protein